MKICLESSALESLSGEEQEALGEKIANEILSGLTIEEETRLGEVKNMLTEKLKDLGLSELTIRWEADRNIVEFKCTDNCAHLSSFFHGVVGKIITRIFGVQSMEYQLDNMKIVVTFPINKEKMLMVKELSLLKKLWDYATTKSGDFALSFPGEDLLHIGNISQESFIKDIKILTK